MAINFAELLSLKTLEFQKSAAWSGTCPREFFFLAYTPQAKKEMPRVVATTPAEALIAGSQLGELDYS